MSQTKVVSLHPLCRCVAQDFIEFNSRNRQSWSKIKNKIDFQSVLFFPFKRKEYLCTHKYIHLCYMN